MKKKLLLILSDILIAGSLVGLAIHLGPHVVAQLETKPAHLGQLNLQAQYGEYIEDSLFDTSPDPEKLTDKSDTPQLIIPKLSVVAPVIPELDVSKHRIYNRALRHGVGHMKSTASLDSSTGNSLIFGHSSRFIGSGGDYDTIFASLPDLQPGDTIELINAQQRQSYTVTVSKKISANDTSILASDDQRKLTLLTCWPLGTALARWVVQAEHQTIINSQSVNYDG